MTSFNPLDHLSSKAKIYASCYRYVGGDYRLNCQLTLAQFNQVASLSKIKAGEYTFKFSRWTKDTGEIIHDRIYVNVGFKTRYGYSNFKMGYFSAFDALDHDENGNGGIITFHTDGPQSEESLMALFASVIVPLDWGNGRAWHDRYIEYRKSSVCSECGASSQNHDDTAHEWKD